MRIDITVKEVLESKGWSAEFNPRIGAYTFFKDNVFVWRSGQWGYTVAELINGQYKNHIKIDSYLELPDFL